MFTFIVPVFCKSTSPTFVASFFAYIPTDFFVLTSIVPVFFTLAVFPASACANIAIKDSCVVVPSALPKTIFPAFSAVYVVPLFLAKIPTAFLFSNVISPVDVLIPVPVSDTKIPTPLSAVTIIFFLFSAFPAVWANIPEDCFPLTFIVSSFVAVESVSFVNIPIPFSADKLIVFLFSTLEAAWPNIPTDSKVFTFILPLLIPVAFLLARIPIFLLSVAVVEDNVIIPVFSAFTLSFVKEAESLVSIIPVEFLVLTLIFPLFVNVKVVAVPVATVDFTSPNIPAEPSFSIVIMASVPSFAPEAVPPVASLNLAYIPADAFPLIRIVFLFVALECSTYIPADSSSVVVIEFVFSSSPLLPNIPADFFFFVEIVPLFWALLVFDLEKIPTEASSSTVIFPVVSFNKVELFSPNIPVELFPSKVIICLFVTIEALPAIPTFFSWFPVIFPSFFTVEAAAPNIPVE